MTVAPVSRLETTWKRLQLGDVFRVTSWSGNRYELSFLGSNVGGLIARLPDGKPARFYPERLDWGSLELLGRGKSLSLGDEVLFVAADGEGRGRVVAVDEDRVTIRGFSGVSTMTCDLRAAHGLAFLFPASDWRAGDVFLVNSLSGREYQGHTLRVDGERVQAVLSHPTGSAGRPVALRLTQLQGDSLRVRVPLLEGGRERPPPAPNARG